MRVLVTGGMGFIGSNFIQYMLSHYPSYDVINLDSLTYAGNEANMTDYEQLARYRFVHADITDSNAVDQVMSSNIDAVVHFAAESHVDRSIRNPRAFLETNIQGTHQLLESAKRYKVNRFVLVSTDEVYGSLGASGYFTEHSNLAPNSPYAASKASADLMARAYFKTYHYPVIISRCSNNYGPFQFPEKLIPLTIIRALENKSIPIYGDGENVRDWLFVQDHCSALDRILHHGIAGEVYNIGGNNEYSNLDIVRMILSMLGKSESLIQFVQDRPGHDQRYAIDAVKIKEKLGWTPSYDFQRGMKLTLAWYMQNKNWWKPLQHNLNYWNKEE